MIKQNNVLMGQCNETMLNVQRLLEQVHEEGEQGGTVKGFTKILKYTKAGKK